MHIEVSLSRARSLSLALSLSLSLSRARALSLSSISLLSLFSLSPQDCEFHTLCEHIRALLRMDELGRLELLVKAGHDADPKKKMSIEKQLLKMDASSFLS
jgi:hypothetical protein